MNRKILVALSVVLLAIVAMGTASAFEFPDLGSIFGGTPPDQNVTLDGETFHIPGTFKNILPAFALSFNCRQFDDKSIQLFISLFLNDTSNHEGFYFH